MKPYCMSINEIYANEMIEIVILYKIFKKDVDVLFSFCLYDFGLLIDYIYFQIVSIYIF